MIQFNLLPDVKVDYIKASRTKRMVTLAAIAITAVTLFIFVLLLLIVRVFQQLHINNLNSDIKSSVSQLKGVEDLDKVLTVQNQLDKLTGLHEEKPATSRMYDYLIRMTPKDAKVSSVSVDFDANTIEIGGSAVNLETVNKYVDTIKFTDYKDGGEQKRAFSEVVLSAFGVSGAAQGAERTTYTIQFRYEPAIFDNTKTVELVVPNIISTRSVTEAPSDLFEAPQRTQTNGAQ